MTETKKELFNTNEKKVQRYNNKFLLSTKNNN